MQHNILMDYPECSDSVVVSKRPSLKDVSKSAVKSIRFIDLFCGIGGFHKALVQSVSSKATAQCVFSSDIDKYAQKTYFENYGVMPYGDITQIHENNIPEHDILFAGFPCQAFSVAGYRKGFEDSRGTLFFDVARILKHHKPKIAILENVKGLINHDNGKTLDIILNTLKQDLGYYVYYQILNTADYGNIPQNRERIYIICSITPLVNPFPKPLDLETCIKHLLFNHKQDDKYYYNNHAYYNVLNEGMTSRSTVYQWRRHYVRENKKNMCPTLTANMGTGGHNVPLIKDDFGIRKLTPEECLAFQGFDKDFIFPELPQSQKYKQVGNSISVPVVKRILDNLLKEVYAL